MQNIHRAVATVTGSAALLGPFEWEILLALSQAIYNASIGDIDPADITVERRTLPHENPTVCRIDVVVYTDPSYSFSPPDTSEVTAQIFQILPESYKSCEVNITAA